MNNQLGDEDDSVTKPNPYKIIGFVLAAIVLLALIFL